MGDEKKWEGDQAEREDIGGAVGDEREDETADRKHAQRGRGAVGAAE